MHYVGPEFKDKRKETIMRILVTGVKGQLGYDVVNELEKEDIQRLVLTLMKWILQMQKLLIV